MDALYSSVLVVPQLRLKTPDFSWRPSGYLVFLAIFGLYFFIVSGIVYDLINEVPSFGSTVDQYGEGFLLRRSPPRV